DQYVGADIGDGAVRGRDDRVDIGTVGEDHVDIAGGQVSQGLVGGGEGHDGIVGGQVGFGIAGLQGATLNADANAREIVEVDLGAGSGDVARRIGREIFVAEIDGLQTLFGDAHA